MELKNLTELAQEFGVSRTTLQSQVDKLEASIGYELGQKKAHGKPRYFSADEQTLIAERLGYNKPDQPLVVSEITVYAPEMSSIEQPNLSGQYDLSSLMPSIDFSFNDPLALASEAIKVIDTISNGLDQQLDQIRTQEIKLAEANRQLDAKLDGLKQKHRRTELEAQSRIAEVKNLTQELTEKTNQFQILKKQQPE